MQTTCSWIPLLLSATFVPALAEVDLPVALVVEGHAIVELKRGSGPPAKRGDVVTIQFTLRNGAGRELVSTARRGLHYKLAAYPGDEPILVPPLLGMRAGGVREIQMPRGTYPSSKVAGVELFGADLVLRLTLLGVYPPAQR